mmetsp:Transcript_35434/g.88050  ORF Transcript_35434/g.88050 Transcript_35434/m.88050 type:complete len:226 (-) Transcript_35434:265-942(-)
MDLVDECGVGQLQGDGLLMVRDGEARVDLLAGGLVVGAWRQPDAAVTQTAMGGKGDLIDGGLGTRIGRGVPHDGVQRRGHAGQREQLVLHQGQRHGQELALAVFLEQLIQVIVFDGDDPFVEMQRLEEAPLAPVRQHVGRQGLDGVKLLQNDDHLEPPVGREAGGIARLCHGDAHLDVGPPQPNAALLVCWDGVCRALAVELDPVPPDVLPQLVLDGVVEGDQHR